MAKSTIEKKCRSTVSTCVEEEDIDIQFLFQETHTFSSTYFSQSVVKVQEQSPEGRATFYFLPW